MKDQVQSLKNLEGTIIKQFDHFTKRENKMQSEINHLKNTIKKLERKLTENSADMQRNKHLENYDSEYEKRFMDLEKKIGQLEVQNKKEIKNPEKIKIYVKQSYKHVAEIEIETLDLKVSEFMKICKKYVKIDSRGIFCYRGLCLNPSRNLTDYGIKNCDTIIYLYKQI